MTANPTGSELTPRNAILTIVFYSMTFYPPVHYPLALLTQILLRRGTGGPSSERRPI